MHVVPKRKRSAPITSIENLEIRNLLSGIMSADLPAAVPESAPNETLDQATDWGSTGSAAVEGTIDSNGIDVDWYSFTLLVSSEVTLDATAGTLGLYNDAGFDAGDLTNSFGHRLLAQMTAGDSGDASITRTLAAGTYYVAISGKGNTYFNPFLANSGLPGESADYTLEFISTPLNEPVNGDPAPLGVDATPLDVRVGFSGGLDFAPTVELTDAGGNLLAVRWTNFNTAINELQFAPHQALSVGDYTAVIKDASGTVRMTLQVHVADTGMPADVGDDTPATAIDLGALELGLVQVPGIIGDDPYYDFSSLTPAQRPANDVDLYHFQITSTTAVGLQVEVFAGRIGSPLDSGVSLYYRDPVSGQLEFVAGNNQSLNPSQAGNHTVPLLSDSILGAGLKAGDYYVAVSSGSNTPSPNEHQLPGSTSGIFNPEQAHSGSMGATTGKYVLNLRLVELPEPPRIMTVSIANQSTLLAAPTELTIQFSQFVNVAQLAAGSYAQTDQTSVPGISIQDSQGRIYYPHLISFDPVTFTARFQMADRLPSGSYQLHIDGSQGLSNIAGVPLAESTSNTVAFVVSTPAAGTAGDATVWTHSSDTDSAPAVQPLGVLFPQEVVAGVEIVRTAGTGSNRNNDDSDSYSFEVLKTGRYTLTLSGQGLPAGVHFQILDQLGNVVDSATSDDGSRAIVFLKAGSYVLRVEGWPANSARAINYRIAIKALFHADNPPALSTGPAPAVGLRLVTAMNPGGSGGSGSGPGGVGSGIGNSGGSNGGSSGGIPNLGNSSSNLLNAPNDYNTRINLPRLDQDSALDNFVIAIPTVMSNSGTGLGAKLQVARSLRRISGVGRGLTTGRLSEFADGPLGKSRRDQGDLNSSLSTVRSMSRLIDSALVSDRDSIGTKSVPTANHPTPHNQPVIASDQQSNQLPPEEGVSETEGTGGEPQQSDADYTTGLEPQPSKPGIKIHNVSHRPELTDLQSQTATDSVFMRMYPDYDDITATDAELQSACLPDTVFAAGMGLLVANVALQRQRPAGSQKTRDGELHLTSTERLPSTRKNV